MSESEADIERDSDHEVAAEYAAIRGGDTLESRRLPFHTSRALPQLRVYVEAMSHELKDNAHKGDWLTVDPEFDHIEDDLPPTRLKPHELLGDLLYHAAKLGMAMRSGDKQAVLEYAADVGNCAWFCADSFEALDPALLHEGPIEYDQDHEGLDIDGMEFSEYKRITHDWAIELTKPKGETPA